MTQSLKIQARREKNATQYDAMLTVIEANAADYYNEKLQKETHDSYWKLT